MSWKLTKARGNRIKETITYTLDKYVLCIARSRLLEFQIMEIGMHFFMLLDAWIKVICSTIPVYTIVIILKKKFYIRMIDNIRFETKTKPMDIPLRTITK